MSEYGPAYKQGDEFLEKVRTLVEHWDGPLDSGPDASWTCRDRLEGLAHSILTDVDQGNLALVPASLLETYGLEDEDVSGALNDCLFNQGIWQRG